MLAIASLFFLAWHLRGVILMLFGAVVVASVFRAIADILKKRLRLPDAIAVGGSVLIVLATIVGLAMLFGNQIGQQVETLKETLPRAWSSLEKRLGEMGLGEALSQGITGGGAFANIGRTLISVGSGLADTLVVIFGGIFLAAQPNFYRIGLVKLVPAAKRALVTEAMIDSERALRLWLKGQLIAMVIVGILTGVGLWALGMPSALVLGLLAGVLEFIPFAGPILAAIPAILLALAASPDLALWVVLLYIAVQQVEGAVVQPIVQQYAVDLPGVILLFALIAFGTLFGAIGVILAAPLAVVTYVLVKRLYVREALDTHTPIPGETSSDRQTSKTA
ncbi:MAG TPA: AI-2E family transporter [Sphingomicrobium sp.]|nr:AI-2E family transporter [Sphingomicrobium sp.]